METEHLRRAQQWCQTRARQQRRAVRHQRIVDGGQLARKLVRIRIRRRFADFVPCHFITAQRTRRGGETRVYARERAPVGFVLAVG